MSNFVDGSVMAPLYPERCFWNWDCKNEAAYFEEQGGGRRVGCCEAHLDQWLDVNADDERRGRRQSILMTANCN